MAIFRCFGVANVLTDYRENIAGTIRFLFQPTEERFPGGALSMIEEGALDGVDAIIGAHLWQPIPIGTVGIKSGRFMASPDEFSLRFKDEVVMLLCLIKQWMRCLQPHKSCWL